MFQGRFTLGGEANLSVLCVDRALTPFAPDAAPLAEVWAGAPAKVWARLIPAMDQGRVTGLFTYRLFLGRGFATGPYRVVYRYRGGSNLYVKRSTFSIVAGGNVDGSVLSMYPYSRPGAKWIVQQLESGGNVAGKNPYI